MNFGTEKELEIFNKLAYRSTYEVGLEYGFDKVYKDPRAIKNAVYSLFTKVKNNPERYNLTPEAMDIVLAAMKSRAASSKRSGPSITEQNQDVDFKQVVLNTRDAIGGLISRKIQKMQNSKKALDAVSLKELTTAFGIMFDKGQIVKGEATEHIAHYAKIDGELTPEQAMEMILKGREAVQASKQK